MTGLGVGLPCRWVFSCEWIYNRYTHIHGLDHGLAHLMAVVAHSIHGHVHSQFTSDWFPEGIPRTT